MLFLTGFLISFSRQKKQQHKIIKVLEEKLTSPDRYKDALENELKSLKEAINELAHGNNDAVDKILKNKGKELEVSG